ncbi:MAG: hypothetical protein AAB393_04800, partial [Bacteroidota bacterium]
MNLTVAFGTRRLLPGRSTDERSLQYAIHCARMEDEKDRKGIFNKDRKHAMRLYLINPSNPLVSIV